MHRTNFRLVHLSFSPYHVCYICIILFGLLICGFLFLINILLDHIFIFS